MIELNKIYNEDCLISMSKIDDNFVDLTLTSPPYDNLRTYNGYSFEFEKIAQQLFRITKPGGVICWVINDQYINGGRSLTSFKQALYFQQCGFTMHDVMIYEKANFSNPARNRYHQIYEFMFILSKGKPKTFNPILDKKNKYGVCLGKNTKRNVDGEMIEVKKPKSREFGMRTNIWRMNTVGQENPCKSHKHPAMFPKKLAHDQILSWSNEGDVVYDCFLGSGTTAEQAQLLNRLYIGSEISADYCKIAEDRLNIIKNYENRKT